MEFSNGDRLRASSDVANRATSPSDNIARAAGDMPRLAAPTLHSTDLFFGRNSLHDAGGRALRRPLASGSLSSTIGGNA